MSLQAVSNTTHFLSLTEIPAGRITLRDDRLKHTWTVDLDAFLLSKFQITQAFYQQLTGANPSAFTGEDCPVETVSWFDAVVFCNKLSQIEGLDKCYELKGDNDFKVTYNTHANGYRLPTEAEWEYACKADVNTIRYGELDKIAWYKSNSNATTHPVGLKDPNRWGLYDMLGNVWEWCNDIYDEQVYGSYRIFRGGGWFDEERGCIATNRRRSHPSSFKIDDLGFRIARNL